MSKFFVSLSKRQKLETGETREPCLCVSKVFWLSWMTTPRCGVGPVLGGRMLWKHGRNRLRMPGSWWACVGLIAGVVGELYQALCMADCESVRNRAWVAENLGLNFREKVYVCVCQGQRFLSGPFLNHSSSHCFETVSFIEPDTPQFS